MIVYSLDGECRCTVKPKLVLLAPLADLSLLGIYFLINKYNNNNNHVSTLLFRFAIRNAATMQIVLIDSSNNFIKCP